MAQADTSIYSNALSRMKSVADYDNEYAQQEGNKLALKRNALALQTGELGLQEQQRSMAEAQAFRNALSQPGFDPSNPQSLNALMRVSPGLAQKFVTDQQALKKGAVELQKSEGETLDASLKRQRELLALVNDPQSAAQWLTSGYNDPQVGKILQRIGPLEEGLKRIPQTPEEFQRWKLQAASGVEKFIELTKPTIQNRDTGGAVQTIAVDPLSGRPTVTGSVEKTQSPDNRASVGASLANASATRDVASATRDAANARRDQDTEMKLADDYRAQSKGFKEVVDAHKRVDAALKTATTSAASTLAAATSFMKMLDPGSVVRESELGMALAATGALDRAMNYFNVLQRGKVLTKSQADDFQKISGQVLEAAKQGQKAIDADYKGKAEAYKLRPEMVVQELGQNSAAPGPAPLDVPADIADLLKKHGGK